jgi:pimeloyl-ACP methyl ester carboxylesterase
VALNREFAGYYAEALKAKGLPAADVRVPEEHDSGWMPFAVYFSLGMKYDHTASLSRITCPVLIISGEKDIAVTADGIRSYQDNIKNVTLNTIPNAAHFSYNEQPQEFAKAIGAFLQEK